MKYAVIVKGREDFVVIATPDKARVTYEPPKELGAEGLFKIGMPFDQPQCTFRACEIVGIYALVEEAEA